ncbi:MAG: peptidoglycan-binding protein [Candidatus Omnitrophica bacterium]|nr:peptidoglycan-binding protein [Candidatus Omnitrophota bacterium]
MKKTILNLSASCFVLASVFFPLSLADAGSITLLAPSAVLLDGRTQQVLYAKAPHTKRAPASTTKLLTVMVALDHLSLDKIVQIPPGLEYIQPSKIGLHAGERFYVRDLVKAALIKSANDAAEALAILTAGSRSAFAKLMNQKVISLGATNSHFVNPNGLPASAQYSTAYDLARIMMAASKYPYIVNTLKIRSTVISSRAGRKIALNNCNKMLWRTGGVIGKTGWTRAARHCFAGRVQARGQVIFVGLMGSPSRQYLWSDLRRIAAIPSGKMPKPIVSAPAIPVRKDTMKIQQALQRAGYFKGNPTGFYGKRTQAAVRNFQKAKGIQVTGTVGPKTWKKLKAYL